MIEVIGYESGASDDHPLIWGAAAVRTKDGIYNAVTGFGSVPQEEWDNYLRKGSATQLEISVPCDDELFQSPLFVMDLRIDLLDRKPYKVGRLPEMYGIVAIGRGATRGYYIFSNHDRLTSWLYHLHACKFELTPITGK